MSGTWKKQSSPVDDPLAAYHGKPVISHGGPNQHYLGRVVVELWEDGSTRDDSYKLALSSDAVDGNYTKLRQRVAAALPVRVLRDSPFESASMPNM